MVADLVISSLSSSTWSDELTFRSCLALYAAASPNFCPCTRFSFFFTDICNARRKVAISGLLPSMYLLMAQSCTSGRRTSSYYQFRHIARSDSPAICKIYALLYHLDPQSPVTFCLASTSLSFRFSPSKLQVISIALSSHTVFEMKFPSNLLDPSVSYKFLAWAISFDRLSVNLAFLWSADWVICTACLETKNCWLGRTAKICQTDFFDFALLNGLSSHLFHVHLLTEDLHLCEESKCVCRIAVICYGTALTWLPVLGSGVWRDST